MASPLRVQFPGAIYHVMSRGSQRRPIIRDDSDRTRWMEWLRRTVETCGWRLRAFKLMSNHDHLFVEIPEANLAAGMQFLNGSNPATTVAAALGYGGHSSVYYAMRRIEAPDRAGRAAGNHRGRTLLLTTDALTPMTLLCRLRPGCD